ncbi:hypothetical protein A1Q1_03305 [Trichosporon asahii var. asahii CBS 2479]|uniref:Siderophore-iron transporter n=1 Tax=Trichosporon asahii var. asahii (strain ATCC 90039 / CBS 2479 / JCM 2466 / KCTC 7840 / NBRC 103889/ NCYC 2677 / UAMH 7654) TaxID=1186058 RepID=J6ETE6_TRIAS|nr:hypothetical protein A1Q1_03305 [Trichosporon asahii var. asahii CBS 2479]EJT47844.1 hypothetical protein A1Q1_03305 [Trichosporon asahii var. asahii CBS 2479]
MSAVTPVGREVGSGAAVLPEKVDDIEIAPESPSTESDAKLERTESNSSRVSFQQYIDLVFPRGWKLVLLWTSIALIAAFATSSFGKHTVVGLMAVINNIMSAVALPFLSKICDFASRPLALSVATLLFTLGYVVVAAAPTVVAVAAGEAIFTAGRTGIYQIMHILICDMTQLQWRGIVLGCYSLPWIMNGFLGAKITSAIRVTSSIDGETWRWGYGMFTIIIPVAIAPSILVMFWGHRRAKKLGALSLASSSYARRQALEGIEPPPKKAWWRRILDLWSDLDGFGLLLFGFALALLLCPPTLTTFAKGGYANPSLIAMYVVGGVLFIAFIIWDTIFAKSPIWAARLMNRTFLLCTAVDAFHFFSTGLHEAYYNSWVYIIKPTWSEYNYSTFSNIHNMGMCFFAVCAGVLMRFTHRYRYIQMSGLIIRLVGEGLNYYSLSNQSDVVLVMAKLMISCGAGFIITTTAVAAPASVPHKDMAGAMSILHMVAQLAGSIAGSISASIWNSNVPKNLEKYLPELSDSARAKVFGSVRLARRQEPHDMVVRAYTEAYRPMMIIAICTTGVALILSLFIKDMNLGRAHNDVERHKEVRMRTKSETDSEILREKVEAAEAQARTEVEAEEKRTTIQ